MPFGSILTSTVLPARVELFIIWIYKVQTQRLAACFQKQLRRHINLMLRLCASECKSCKANLNWNWRVYRWFEKGSLYGLSTAVGKCFSNKRNCLHWALRQLLICCCNSLCEMNLLFKSKRLSSLNSKEDKYLPTELMSLLHLRAWADLESKKSLQLFLLL